MKYDYYDRDVSDEVFDDMKKCAIQVWRENPNYERIVGREVKISEYTNTKGNRLYIYQMFNKYDQYKIKSMLSDEAFGKILDFESDDYGGSGGSEFA